MSKATRLAAKPAPAPGIFTREGCCVPAASPASASGERYVRTPQEYDAVLLVGFGGPEGQDDVIPFLRNVTAGRGIPDSRLEEVAGHYRARGGVSPINEQNRLLRDGLEKALAAAGAGLPVYLGNRNWGPYLPQVLAEAHSRGHDRLLAVVTSAYASYSSCRQYREDLADALVAARLDKLMTIDKVRQYFDHPGFVEPFIDGLAQSIVTLSDRGSHDVQVLFTTHSIPTTDANHSGPVGPGLGNGGAYVAQHEVVAKTIIDAIDTDLDYRLVYQSRSGAPTQPWLEPDINDAVHDAAWRGKEAVILVPIGFVSDHMEVLWDLDTEAKQTAAEVGLDFIRVPTPATDSRFVASLADLVVERMQAPPVAVRPALTSLGPWQDVCAAGCCENARRGFRPAVAGVAP